MRTRAVPQLATDGLDPCPSLQCADEGEQLLTFVCKHGFQLVFRDVLGVAHLVGVDVQGDIQCAEQDVVDYKISPPDRLEPRYHQRAGSVPQPILLSHE